MMHTSHVNAAVHGVHDRVLGRVPFDARLTSLSDDYDQANTAAFALCLFSSTAPTNPLTPLRHVSNCSATVSSCWPSKTLGWIQVMSAVDDTWSKVPLTRERLHQ